MDFANTQVMLDNFYEMCEVVNAAILDKKLADQELRRVANECRWTHDLAARKLVSLEQVSRERQNTNDYEK